MLTEVVYLGKDNTIDLLLKADGEAQDLSDTTRMTLGLDDTVIDSATSPDAFDWDTGTTGKLVLALGAEAIDAGVYKRAVLVVYNADNPNGVVWGRLNIIVKSI